MCFCFIFCFVWSIKEFKNSSQKALERRLKKKEKRTSQTRPGDQLAVRPNQTPAPAQSFLFSRSRAAQLARQRRPPSFLRLTTRARLSVSCSSSSFGTEPDSHRSRVRSRKRRDFLALSRNRPLFNPLASLACLFSVPTRVFSPSRLVSSPSGSCRKPNPPPHAARLSRYSSALAKHSSESVVSSSIPWRIPFAVWCAEARKPQAPASTGPPAMAATAPERKSQAGRRRSPLEAISALGSDINGPKHNLPFCRHLC